MIKSDAKYVGFWARTAASIIDSVLLGLLMAPLIWFFYAPSVNQFDDVLMVSWSSNFLVSYVLPACVVIFFWIKKQATPGKMLFSARIVDANTGQPASTGQLIGRYLGYFVSIIPLFLGIIWVAFDQKKQGWHDKLAGTVVISD